MHLIFTRIFQKVLNEHAPVKQKKVRGSHTPFMTKDLSKAIMNKSKTRNKYLKWPSREIFLAMKSAKNLYNNLTKTSKKSYFQKVTQLKALLIIRHSGIQSNNNAFSSQYVSIVKKTHWVKPLI